MEKERILVLDTETTGLDYEKDKIIEIGIVELNDNILSQHYFHEYINPEKEISLSAQNIHGISNEFLKNKPVFHEIVKKFLDFIKNDTLIIHNSAFDTKFINKELENCGFGGLNNNIIDTIKIAKKEFPGQMVSLDSLCRKLNIVNTRNEYHGALLDATLLTKVYLKLTTGKQEKLNFIENKLEKASNQDENDQLKKNFLTPRNFLMKLSDVEEKDHENFISDMKNSIWKKIK